MRDGWMDGEKDGEVNDRGEGCHWDSVNDVQMAWESPLPTPVI